MVPGYTDELTRGTTSTHSCAARFRIHWRADLTQSETKAQFSYLMCTPEMAREMINLWISLVPSKIV